MIAATIITAVTVGAANFWLRRAVLKSSFAYAAGTSIIIAFAVLATVVA